MPLGWWKNRSLHYCLYQQFPLEEFKSHESVWYQQSNSCWKDLTVLILWKYIFKDSIVMRVQLVMHRLKKKARKPMSQSDFYQRHIHSKCPAAAAAFKAATDFGLFFPAIRCTANDCFSMEIRSHLNRCASLPRPLTKAEECNLLSPREQQNQ